MSLQEDMRRLYSLDRQVRGLQARLDAATSRFKRQETKCQQLLQQKQELADQLKHTQVAANSFETQTQEAEQRIDKLREQMNTITSNKEYSALLVEVNTLKLDKSKLEDQALEHLTRVDQLKEEVAGYDQRLAEQQKIVDAADKEVQDCQSEIGERLDSLSTERQEAATQIPAGVLSTFNRVADHFDGEAMAEVAEVNRKAMEYTCGGCYMNIPIERVNALMMQPDEMTCCASCGRILYMDEELKASFAH